MTFCLYPGDKQFVCPPWGKHFLHTGGRGEQTFLLGEGDKHFYLGRGGQTFFVGGGGAYDDVDEELVVNIFVSEASKLSAGARILGAHRALKF